MVDAVMYSSKKDTWMTPETIAKPVEKMYSDGYLDPSPPVEINTNMPLAYYDKDADYLVEDWKATNVYCNPPYGRYVTGKWTEKFKEEFKKQNFENGMMLLPGRIGAKWFQSITRDASCWCAVDGRLKFIGADNCAPYPSAVVLYTTDFNIMYDFIKEFGKIGIIWQGV